MRSQKPSEERREEAAKKKKSPKLSRPKPRRRRSTEVGVTEEEGRSVFYQKGSKTGPAPGDEQGVEVRSRKRQKKKPVQPREARFLVVKLPLKPSQTLK